MKKLLLLCLALAGCSTAPKSKPTIQVDSEPPGAKVFFGAGANTNRAAPKNFLGTTPFTWTPELDRDGRWDMPRISFYNNFGPQGVIVVEARPADDATNLFPQSVIFRGAAAFRDSDPVPARIFFDLRKK